MNTPAPVHLGDWLTLAPTLPPRSIDLLYTDPPFNTGRTHTTPPNASKRAAPLPVPSAQSPVPSSSFSDTFPSTAAYIAWLRERLTATLPALKPSASILIHCDYRTSHHIRLLLDDLLGPDRFVNHLIWQYGLGGSSPRTFARKHDDILFYCLNPDLYYFDPPLVPATSNRLKGKMKKATDVFSVPPSPREGDGGWANESPNAPGVTISSLLPIPSLNNMATERTGYPTQKPLQLLDLLIRATCPPGGTALDPTCGSGTTLVAATAAGRNAIGFDINHDAIHTATARLTQAGLRTEDRGPRTSPPPRARTPS